MDFIFSVAGYGESRADDSCEYVNGDMNRYMRV